MKRRRGIQALMGTLALVAGCSTAQRAEVSGVVRDRATGRVIAGARVIGADGSLAETDANGRFHLFVSGAHADVRVSAWGHSSEHLEIAGLDARVELAPIETWIVDPESAHVITFVEETWVSDAGVRDASAVSIDPHASGDGDHCAQCHADEARAIRGDGSTISAHDALGGGCLACHDTSASRDATRACGRCHGDDAARVTSTLARATDYAMRSTHDPAFTTFSYDRPPDLRALGAWAEALARDRSHGAHDPRLAIAIAHAIE
jgi:hypothetical protein